MKPKKKSVFSTKVLTQAVVVGLLMLSTEAVASSGASNAGSLGTSVRTGTTNTTTTNLDKTINHFQTIGDLEIYQAATAGKVTMTMMLDLSGSMRLCFEEQDGDKMSPLERKGMYGIETYKLTDNAGLPVTTVKDEKGKDIDVSKGIKVVHAYCKDGGRNRLSELKHAVLSMIADGTALPSDYKVGIGVFPYFGDNLSRMVLPAKELTVEHRYRIMRDVAGMYPVGFTPSVQAFAEAGAYMLGTTTTAFKTNAQRKTAFLMAGSLSDDSAGGGTKGYTVFRPCISYTAFFERSNGFVSHNLSPAQMLTYIRGENSSTGGWVRDSRKSPTVLANDTWYSCASDLQTVGDYRYTDFAALGFNPDVSPIRIKGGAFRQNNGLDLNYFGYFTDAYDPVTNKHYTLENNTLPNITYRTSTVPDSSWINLRKPFILGEKIEFIEEIEDTPFNSNPSEQVNYSGFANSRVDTKKSDLRSYESPLSVGGQSCDGAGIFFLTDGFPNRADPSGHVMARSLGYSERDTNAIYARMRRDSGGKDDLRGTLEANGWAQLGAYAAILRNPEITKKPIIKTATLGFGPDFVRKNFTVRTKTVTDDRGRSVEVPVCEDYLTPDIVSLCKLGGIGYGYGEGGFTATSSAAAVAQSVINFAGGLQQAISNQPAGTISVPKDPLSVTNIQPYAYLPMIAPRVAEPDALWAGNLKKYHTLNGTLYGKDTKTRLYERSPNATTENRDFPSQFNANVQDIWQTVAGGGAKIEVGGTYGTIKSIKTDSSFTSRTLWLENYKNFQDNVPATYAQKEIVEVGIKNGKLTGFSNLKDPYNITDKAYIVNYLGVNVPVDDDSIESDEDLQAAVDVAIRNKSFHDTLLGGVLHSVPVLATYRGEFETETGAISSDEGVRQDHLLYGSMDGALHLVEAKTGRENFAFVPRAMFEDTQQRHAMLKGSQLDRMGQPKFGVDAPWVTHAEYVYDFGKNPAEVRAKTMYAFGGLRMGGSGIYGLNITNRDKPELNFAITRYNDQFRRLGQIWAKPTVAKIKTGPKPRDVKDVVIFGGGYDMCYEHPLFELGASDSVVSFNTTHLHREQVPDNTISTKDGTGADIRTTSCANKTQAMGNAVYMVDAKNGTLIARWQAGEGSDDRRHMLHSVVGEITTLDSNNNGAIDHLYFADLGGQVFRVDLKEQASGTAITRRVVRVLDANGHSDKSANHINYRFYDKPLVTFYDHGGKSFAVVNVASGDRSSPVHTHRTSENANRIYGFFDRDLTTNKLDRANLDMSKLLSRNITSNQLEKINTKDVETQGATKVNDVFGKLQAGVLNTNPADNGSVRQGWYYDMNRFDGRINVSGLKSIGLGTVMGNVYYANIYSPSYEYTKAQDCSARVSGGTERQLYCLPWGICADSKNGNRPTTANGVLGYLKAGPGIQELAIGTVTNTADKSGNFRAILGHQSLKEIAETNRTQRERAPGGDQSSALSRLPDATKDKVDGGEGSGGDVYGPNVLIQPRYTLAVQRWYDLQNENQSN